VICLDSQGCGFLDPGDVTLTLKQVTSREFKVIYKKIAELMKDLNFYKSFRFAVKFLNVLLYAKIEIK
jgi:hypothetical protein